jgi:enoyl-CoA hydratase/carnithine racemase
METVDVTRHGSVTTMCLNRSDVRNAFNEIMIAESQEAFAGIDASVRAVVLTGAGTVLCVGADVNRVQRSVTYSEEENAHRETVALLARLRISPEGQESVIAFLEKRRPNGARAEWRRAFMY